MNTNKRENKKKTTRISKYMRERVKKKEDEELRRNVDSFWSC